MRNLIFAMPAGVVGLGMAVVGASRSVHEPGTAVDAVAIVYRAGAVSPLPQGARVPSPSRIIATAIGSRGAIIAATSLGMGSR